MRKVVKNHYPRFAVIGAGNGGQAMAAHLSLKGCSVNLYNRSIDKLECIKEEGGIHVEGCIEGFGHLNLLTDNIYDAVSDVDIIMVTVPASGHRDIAALCAPHLKDGQIIVLNPGRTGGALEFLNILRNQGLDKDVILAEAQTFLYACRVIAPARVRVFSMKNMVSVAAIPSLKINKVLCELKKVYPEFQPAINVLETSFNNIGAIFHPAPTLLNCGRIEATGGDFDYYTSGITPSVARVMEGIDSERVKVANALGIEAVSALKWLELSYGSRGNDLYEAIHNTQGYIGIKAPSSLDTRYIFEEIPESLVPISSIGTMLGIRTPTIDSIIQLASVVHNINYFAVGRSIRNLGIEGLTINQINELVTYGSVEQPEGVVA